jgi:hypothetical protein
MWLTCANVDSATARKKLFSAKRARVAPAIATPFKAYANAWNGFCTAQRARNVLFVVVVVVVVVFTLTRRFSHCQSSIHLLLLLLFSTLILSYSLVFYVQNAQCFGKH